LASPVPETTPASLRQQPEELLATRLMGLGLAAGRRVVTHTNRTVMLSLTPTGPLRIHQGYCHAPDRILRAIIRYLNHRLPKDRRRLAEREFLSFPVQAHVPAGAFGPRHDRPRPGDDSVLLRLRGIHRRLNEAWFERGLRELPFRLSGRMKTRLGEVCLNSRTGAVINIAISRRHIRRDGWAEVERTVLHEMVHQWQAETDQPVDHGTMFRRKAREVGVEPAARRDLGR
jgi:hypothetical protein